MPEAEGNECPADTKTDIQSALAFAVHVFPFRIEEFGGRPAEKHELHAVGMSRQRELDVGLRQYLATPVGRVVAEQHFEHMRRVVALSVPGDSGQSLFQVAAFGKGRFPSFSTPMSAMLSRP